MCRFVCVCRTDMRQRAFESPDLALCFKYIHRGCRKLRKFFADLQRSRSHFFFGSVESADQNPEIFRSEKIEFWWLLNLCRSVKNFLSFRHPWCIYSKHTARSGISNARCLMSVRRTQTKRHGVFRITVINCSLRHLLDFTCLVFQQWHFYSGIESEKVKRIIFSYRSALFWDRPKSLRKYFYTSNAGE